MLKRLWRRLWWHVLGFLVKLGPTVKDGKE